MAFPFLLAFAGLAAAQGVSSCPDPAQTCMSFGVDFQNGGDYFQNSMSNALFTFVSQFEGCQNDIVQNFLVLPDGTDVLCSNTSTTPADLNMVSTCPVQKSQLQEGSYSLILVSNNGNCASFSAERDIEIDVGPQQSVTLPPSTAIVTATSTPVVNSTTTQVVFATSTNYRNTVTVHATDFTSTSTFNLEPLTQTVEAFFTGTVTQSSAVVVTSTATRTAICSHAVRAFFPDPSATKQPTAAAGRSSPMQSAMAAIFGSSFPAFPGFSGLSAFGARDEASSDRIAKQLRRREVKKRSPDERTTTVTPTYVVTSTSTVVDPQTYTQVVVAYTTSTRTTNVNSATTTTRGTVDAVYTTIIASPSITQTFYVPFLVTQITLTSTSTAIATTTTTPPGLSASCSSNGGFLTAT